MAPSFPREFFIELMQKRLNLLNSISITLCTYGVAMCSHLGPMLANIFVGYYESVLFGRVKKPLMYYCYVYDTFAIFDSENDCNQFLHQLNSLHPSLRFIFEKEVNQCLPFLDVLVEKVGSKFITSVYRKPTFTGQYLNLKSFSPGKRKISLISTIPHRALMICSEITLQIELRKFFQY